jgi:general secretion pathway protein I
MNRAIVSLKHGDTETRRGRSRPKRFLRVSVSPCFNEFDQGKIFRNYSVIVRHDPRRDGFSLLEVILALAILAASLAVLGQLIQIGMTHARQAEDMTQAVILCESIMAEIVCGYRPPTDESQVPCDDDANFLFSVVNEETDLLGLIKVTVVVERDPSSVVDPAKCDLARLVVDPDYVASLSESATTGQ